jgi:heme iron utilization protein
MSKENHIKSYIEDSFRSNNLAVLATEGDGQPHACFIAITPMADFEELIFATYRSTRKYQNLIRNGKVAILFENRSTIAPDQSEIIVVTAFGHAKEIEKADYEALSIVHLVRHPDLESFLLSPDCTIFQVKVNAYQVVSGIEDIQWWRFDENHSPS